MSVGRVVDGQSSLDDGEREAGESPHQVNPRQSGGAFLKGERARVSLLINVTFQQIFDFQKNFLEQKVTSSYFC